VGAPLIEKGITASDLRLARAGMDRITPFMRVDVTK
jgi:hypothetical protein